MKDLAELNNWIMDELAPEGWWSSGYDVFIKQAERLNKLGVPLDDIKDILEKIYYAMCGEFGQ